MADNPFKTVSLHLQAVPLARWGAVLSSAAVTVLLVLLFPLLYLFADLMVWQGHWVGYSGLPPARQKAFRDEWDQKLAQRPDVTEALNKLRPAEYARPDEWDARWLAAVVAHVSAKADPEAADVLLKSRGEPVGLLATLVRERGRWTGVPLGWLARLDPWAWRPSETGSANVAYLTQLGGFTFGLLFLRGLLLHAAAYSSAVATIGAATRLRRQVYGHAFRLGSVAVRPEAQTEAGELVTRKVELIRHGLHAALTGAVRGPLLVALLIPVLFLIHPWLTLSLLVLGALVWIVAGQAAAVYRRDARVAARRAETRLKTMRESLALMRLVKGFLMERFSQSRFERHLSDLAKSEWREERGDAFTRPTLLAVASLAGVAVLYLAGRVLLGGEITAAGLVTMVAAIATLVYGVNRWIAARVRVARRAAAAADVVEFLDRRGDAAQGIDAEFLPPMQKKLELVEVSLREPGSGRMVLDGVTLTLPAGSKTAVVFSDPAEAHALAHLVTRLVEPTGGEVRVDGKNLRWVTFESVRTQTALVMEQTPTFSDTVANNIGCGEANYTLPQIVEAAKVAHAHQFVQRLPYGYETLIGDGGASLSPGQRFRIALARAILRDPSLIVIEEPAESLDPDSWVLIDDTLSRIAVGRTLLFLARRPSTVKSADRVYVLQGGKLAAAGSHDELLAGSQLYRLIHFKQTLAPPTTV